MDHMLAVHVVQRRRDPRADVGDGHGIERRAFGKREKGTPRQVLHHDVGLAREIGGGDEARHVRARQPRQDHLLDLEADDRPRALAIGDERDLHEQGLPVRGMRDAPEQGHAAPMQRFNEGEAVDYLAGQKRQHQATTASHCRDATSGIPTDGTGVNSAGRPPRAIWKTAGTWT